MEALGAEQVGRARGPLGDEEPAFGVEGGGGVLIRSGTWVLAVSETLSQVPVEPSGGQRERTHVVDAIDAEGSRHIRRCSTATRTGAP